MKVIRYSLSASLVTYSQMYPYKGSESVTVFLFPALLVVSFLRSPRVWASIVVVSAVSVIVILFTSSTR